MAQTLNQLTELELKTVKTILDNVRHEPALSQESLGFTSVQKAAVERAYQKLFLATGISEPILRDKETRKKCLVLTCTNHNDEGNFVGDLCFPCHHGLSSGNLGKSGPVFRLLVHNGLKVTEEELDLIFSLRAWSNAQQAAKSDV